MRDISFSLPQNIVFTQIMDEADLDDDKTLSFAEFEHVISKAPDFVKYV